MLKTNEKKEYFNRIAELRCIICQMPAEIHHIRNHTGMSKKSTDVLPICPQHHRTGGLGIAFHAGRKTWEAKFGTQLELLAKVKGML